MCHVAIVIYEWMNRIAALDNVMMPHYVALSHTCFTMDLRSSKKKLDLKKKQNRRTINEF